MGTLDARLYKGWTNEREEMMSELIPFEFENKEVRVFIVDGKPAWANIDICGILGIVNARDVFARVPDNEKGVVFSDTLGGKQEISVLYEPGLYRVIFKSIKPAAQRLQAWTFGEVLPQIRQTGRYDAKPKAIDKHADMRAIAEMAESVAEMREVQAGQQAEIEQIKNQQIQDLKHRLEIAEQATQAVERADDAWETSAKALAATEYMTLGEYLREDRIGRKFDTKARQEIGHIAGKLCQQRNLSVHPRKVAGKRWDRENTYPVSVISESLRIYLRSAG